MTPFKRAEYLRRVALLLIDGASTDSVLSARVASALLWLDPMLHQIVSGGLTHHDCDRAHRYLLEVAGDLDEHRPGMGEDDGPEYVACTHCSEPVRVGEELGGDDESLCPDCFTEFRR